MFPKCSIPGCRSAAKSQRAKYCEDCFSKQAALASLKRKTFGGNNAGRGAVGNKGNSAAKGAVGNKGNGASKGAVGNNGNSAGAVGAKGNSAARGAVGNAGNRTKGKQRPKTHWRRSALRRSTKILLVVKKPWIDLILNKKITWEIRESSTKIRGRIHLGLSDAGGRIVGQCHITGSMLVTKDLLKKNVLKHRIKNLNLIKYKNPHAWILRGARRYKHPFNYEHPQGAIIWIRL